MEQLRSAVTKTRDAVKAHPGAAIVATNALTAAAFIWVLSEGKPIKWLTKTLFKAAMSAVPASVMDEQIGKIKKDIEKEVIGHSLDGETIVKTIPDSGWAKDKVVSTLEHYGGKDAKHWTSGKISGCIYHGGSDLSTIMTEAFSRFALSNPLHPDVFPSLRKMEAEVVSMTLGLFNARPECVGTMTSGGTESILMAVKAYRDLAKKTRGVTEPELVVPRTAHAAFDKACDYFGVRLIHLDVDQKTFTVSPAAVAKAITRNTIGLVCSAPNFPQGTVDPVEAIAAIGKAKGIPVHVDCCLGSFLIPFANEVYSSSPDCASRKPLQPFDFRVDGVTSISTDTHKYGFAPKGSSVVMYSSEVFRHHQYFVAPEWTGGIYASPSIAGSRPGALIAACWATLVHVGKDGYRAAARKILSAAVKVSDGIKSRIPELTLLGEPDLSVVCFAPSASAVTASGKALSIYNVGDEMKSRGWNLNVLQNPPSIHLCVTYANADKAAINFVDDLQASVKEVQNAPPGKYKNGSGAIYGMASSIPDKSLVNQVAYGFLDTLYKA